MSGLPVTELIRVPPLDDDGKYRVIYTDAHYSAMEREAHQGTVSARLSRIENDMVRILNAIEQLESLIARATPIIDGLAENPAKTIMSMMGGRNNGR